MFDGLRHEITDKSTIQKISRNQNLLIKQESEINDLEFRLNNTFKLNMKRNKQITNLSKELIKYYVYFQRFSRKTEKIQLKDFQREYSLFQGSNNDAKELYDIFNIENKQFIDFSDFVRYFKPNITLELFDKAMEKMTQVLMISKYKINI